jgi:membrane protein
MAEGRIFRDVAIAAGIGLAGAYLVQRFAPRPESAREAAFAEKSASRSQAGSLADHPTGIPARGWMDILRRTYHEMNRDRVQAVAAGVTFYALLSLFPALTAFVSLYGLVAEPATIGEQLALADGFLPAGSVDFLREQIGRIASAGEAKLGFAFILSVALATWSANAGVKAIFDALNVAYGEDEKRSFFKLNAISLLFTIAILAFVILAITGIAAIPVMLDAISLGGATEWLIWLGRWPLLIAALMLGLSVLYRFGPSRDDARWAWVSPGALFASIGWLAASLAFSWYVANFEDYNKTYGAIGAVIGLLTWMWLSAIIILLGAELNSEAERQTDRDTTVGTPMPIGLRGADAADNKR